MSLLQLNNISKFYNLGGNLFYALKDINLVIEEGEFISITGASGSGKSTLMHIIGLLDTPSTGQVLLENRDISKLNQAQLAQARNITVGFVFQQFHLLAKTSALDNVILPLLYSEIPTSQRKILGLEMLQKVNLESKNQNFPNQLSGGEQQRVAIARALVNHPKLILADEPTGNLDSKSGREVMDILHQLHEKENKTIVFVSHDMSLANEAHRQIILKDGQIINIKSVKTNHL